jgi:hypothetical protein
MKQKIHPLPMWGMKNTTFVLYLRLCNAMVHGRRGNMDSFTGELASHSTVEYNATIWNENVACYRIADVKIPA